MAYAPSSCTSWICHCFTPTEEKALPFGVFGDEPAFGVIICTNNKLPVEIQPVADGNIRIIGNIHDKSDEKQDAHALFMHLSLILSARNKIHILGTSFAL